VGNQAVLLPVVATARRSRPDANVSHPMTTMSPAQNLPAA
jgi:hypothetical protein